MLRKVFNILAIIALMAGFLYSGNVMAQDSVDPDLGTDSIYQPVSKKPIDEPNAQDYLRNEARAALLRQQDKAAEASSLILTGKDKVLVILVEFAGLDTFTWTKGVSSWDPLNRADPNEGAGITTAGDCSNINAVSGNYSYSGPMHNQIPTPVSATDASGVYIWTQDFNPKWFEDFMFGNGVKINYQRVDGSVVNESFIGKSVRNYYKDMSNGLYDMDGTVVGWLQMPHSAMWYANNQCPGAKSGAPADLTIGHYGGNIPGAGSTRTLMQDAVAAVNTKIAEGQLPGFNWKDYDLDGNGIVDRLWIVHAGYGEESDTVLLNRTNYGEGIPWSHSTSGGTPTVVDPVNNISVGPYIMMPESGGINVFAHEAGHNLGAVDLYTYGAGNTSAGFWTLMSDSWTGYPIAFQPEAMDPMHLDLWGWLSPKVISDPSQVYTVTLQQASTGPSAVPDGAVKGVRIDLPKGQVPQPVPVWQGSYYWFGGKANRLKSQMTLNTPVAIPATATAANLTFDLAYDTEYEWDYLWVQVSDNGGTTWKTLANTNTICTHDPDWIGEGQGFPKDMCAAGVGGFSGHNPGYPAPQAQTFNLTAFIGKNILVKFWYMTDSNTLGAGPFLDNVAITATSSAPADGGTVLFTDNAETVNSNWTYASVWDRSNGQIAFDHSFYVQWRNTNSNGGYDSTLGDTRWRFGKANTGMVMWYNNTFYTDTEIINYLTNYPSFGPKGKMLVVDSHPEPYRFPSKVGNYPNEGANLTSRSLMRDAPFTLSDTVNFIYPDTGTPTNFAGQMAVKTFHDAMGYYPGAEFVTRSQTQSKRWVTKQWDASVVLPSKSAYALNAPGYVGTGGTTNQEFRFNCTINAAGALGCGFFGTGVGLGYNGGNGNPADVNGQYGWHVELVQEGAEHNWATVRIWNSQYAMDSMIVPNQTLANLNDTLTYTASFKNTGSTATFLACAAIDTSKVTYVAGSATGSPLELPSCPTAGADLVVNPSAPVGALVWQLKDVVPGSSAPFTYQVQAVKPGLATTSASIISFPPNQTIYSSQTTKSVWIGHRSFIPSLPNQ